MNTILKRIGEIRLTPCHFFGYWNPDRILSLCESY